MGSRIGALVKAAEDPKSQPLSNELWERFCWLYVFGSDGLCLDADPPVRPHDGNSAYRQLRPDVSEGGARSQTWKLLRRPEVVGRIVELKGRRDEQIKSRSAGFVPYFDSAVQTLDEIRRGIWRPEDTVDLDPRTIPQMARVAYLAANEMVSRVLGSVTQQHEIHKTANPIVVHVMGPGGVPSVHELPGSADPPILEAEVLDCE
jgi:hypothetical protein